ncbi:MAG: VOC family protein [Rhizobiaceae bacterium]|nr:VOC family protein [Rhizobiaceae bacterium]
MSHGTFGWNELMTSDLAASKAFYAKVAGWSYQDVSMGEMGTYTLAFVAGNDVPVAGLMHWPKDRPGSDDWFAYINVDNIDDALEATCSAGGTVAREKFFIDNTGWIGIVQDSAGTMIGFLEPLPM